jgi:hypothetical protein
MKKLRIGLGHSDFETLLTTDCIFVDKSLLIQDVIDDANAILLFPRPRRFGKTLNLSMLRYFFEKRPDGKERGALFQNLKIWSAGEKYQQEQGRHPVIFLSLKDIKGLTFESTLAEFAQTFCKLYNYHHYLLDSSISSLEEKEYFHRILALKGTQSDLENALHKLCIWLHNFHQQKVIVLLDEYDTPIHAGYFNSYFKEITNFMRTLLGGVFKDNEYLQKGVITGILRIAKENLFSGLNNVEVFSLLSDNYAQYFGFTQEEIDNLLNQADAEQEREKVKEWYNGFQFGQIQIYNPWSILCFLKQEGNYLPHWINTADNSLIQETLAHSNITVKQDFERLLAGETITKIIDEYVVLQDITQSEERVWSFLLFTGYLKVLNKTPLEDQFRCELCLPNKEIRAVYSRVIRDWFPSAMPSEKYKALLKSLVEGDVELFEELLQEALMDSLSYFDIKGKNPEQFYHALVLGMLIALQETHQIQSNRESGHGRYDVMLIPKDKSKLGIVIEFKSVKSEAALPEGVKIALQQIQDKHYRQQLLSEGIENILELGIAFYGKQLKLGQVSCLTLL